MQPNIMLALPLYKDRLTSFIALVFSSFSLVFAAIFCFSWAIESWGCRHSACTTTVHADTFHGYIIGEYFLILLYVTVQATADSSTHNFCMQTHFMAI